MQRHPDDNDVDDVADNDDDDDNGWQMELDWKISPLSIISISKCSDYHRCHKFDYVHKLTQLVQDTCPNFFWKLMLGLMVKFTSKNITPYS